ncbi:MAG TPA: dihydrofolate reductase family protein [Polyangiaceae bacterium]|jgi:dihydrofolate reductase|nr:dihydrofolate reductase family protein [Polyangiaceae bacterium]
MPKLVYLMNTSLDGFVEGPDGKFDWSVPDEEVHRFHGEQLEQLGTLLYGRRIYETMKVWDTMGDDPSLPDFAREFARIWRSKPKVVFSTTLKSVGENARLVRDDVRDEVTRLKAESDGELSVAGPGLASSLAGFGLIDEFRLVACPVVVGSGKSYFPKLDHALRLRHLETRTFRNGAVYLRYARVE